MLFAMRTGTCSCSTSGAGPSCRTASAPALLRPLPGGRCTAGRCLPSSRLQPPRAVDAVRDFDGNTGEDRGFSISADALADLSPEERSTVRLFQERRCSVVNIATSAAALSLFPILSIQQMPRGVGSGFIWDRKGTVVTNAHVIAGANEVKVTMANQQVYTARLIGQDREKDLAVLRLEMPEAKAAELQPLPLGNSSGLLVGQKVYAIGNPFGLDFTLTSGVVSGLGRELPRGGALQALTNVIQTDAAINPGNSGGPLLDSKGRLIGINTAILDPSGFGISAGIGFAIPIDEARGLIDQLVSYGRVLRPALGVTLAPPSILERRRQEGVLVLGVDHNGPAAAAGLKPTRRGGFLSALQLGDVITALNGRPIRAQRDLFAALDEARVGDVVEVTVRSGSGEKTVKVKLADRSKLAAYG